jgi:hypothetical protein
MSQTIESILAEIDSVVSTTKTASMSVNTTDPEVATLVEKLAQAADALDSEPTSKVATSSTSKVAASNYSAGNYDVVNSVNAESIRLIGMIDEAVNFAKVAGHKGYDEVEAFKFFYNQKLKGLGA